MMRREPVLISTVTAMPGARSTSRPSTSISLRSSDTRLRPQDWKSGERLWVVEVIASFGGAEEMVKDLKAKVFPQRELKFRAVGAQGREVRVL